MSAGQDFDLNIVDAKLTDEGTYECQVLPSDGDPPLRAGAFLTVNGNLSQQAIRFASKWVRLAPNWTN